MSIRTGKDRYDAVETFRDRTLDELKNPEGVIFARDTQPPQHERDFIQSHIQPGDRVLELGSGLGPWAAIALAAGAELYVGVDPVKERVEYAQALYAGSESRVRFSHGDATSLALLDADGTMAQFDVVMFVTVLQHMTLPDAEEAIRTAALHMRPGGKIVLIESRMLDVSEADCERLYAEPGNAKHMIPKPIQALWDAAPALSWEQVGGDRYVLRKAGGTA